MSTRIPQTLGERTDRPLAVLVWVAGAVSLLAALSARDLWAPDEPRYGQVAREMLEGGDWLVPRLNGEPYAEKPPLAYWAMAATGWLLGGLGAVQARLFGAISTAVAAFSLARLARRWFGDPAVGDTAALLLATTALVVWNGSRAGLDMPLAAFGLLAVEAATAVVVRRSILGAVGFGAALGAGLLTKGPHALLVPVSATVGGCVAAGAARRLLDWRWLVGLAIAVAMFLAWLLPAMEAGGPAYADRLVGQISDRVAGQEVPHRNPVWYLPALLLLGALPWTALVLAAGRVVAGLREAPVEHRFGIGAAAAGVLLPLVVLSVPASKRDVYLLPSLPFFACLCAYAVHRLGASPGTRRAVRTVAWIALALAVAAFAAPFVADRVVDLVPSFQAGWREMRFPTPFSGFALGGVGLLCAIGASVALRASTPAAGARALAVAFAAAWIVVATAVLPEFDPGKTHARSAAAADRAAPGAPLVISGFSDSSVTWWFRGRTLRREDSAEGLARLLGAESPVVVLAKERHWRDRFDRTPELQRLLREGRARVLLERSVGTTSYVLLVNAEGR